METNLRKSSLQFTEFFLLSALFQAVDILNFTQQSKPSELFKLKTLEG